MSIDKLADGYEERATKLLTNFYSGVLEEFSTVQVDQLVNHIMSLGIKDTFKECACLILDDEDIKVIVNFNENYKSKTEALEILMTSKLEALLETLDEGVLDKILDESKNITPPPTTEYLKEK